MSELEDFFGPVISSYSRAQAIEDGVLVEIKPEDYDGAGIFKFPVVFTSALFSDLESGKGPRRSTPRDVEKLRGRVWDVCYMMSVEARRNGGSDVSFQVIVGRRTLTLRGNIGPGDTAEPVITIGHPEDF